MYSPGGPDAAVGVAESELAWTAKMGIGADVEYGASRVGTPGAHAAGTAGG